MMKATTTSTTATIPQRFTTPVVMKKSPKKKKTMVIKSEKSGSRGDNDHPIQKLISGFCAPLSQLNNDQRDSKDDNRTGTTSGDPDSSCLVDTGPSLSPGANNRRRNSPRLTIDTNVTSNNNVDDNGIPSTISTTSSEALRGTEIIDDAGNTTTTHDESMTAMLHMEVSKRVVKHRQKYGLSIFLAALLSVVTTLYALRRLGYNIVHIKDRQSWIDEVGTQFFHLPSDHRFLSSSTASSSSDASTQSSSTTKPRPYNFFDIVWKYNIPNNNYDDGQRDDVDDHSRMHQSQTHQSSSWSFASMFDGIIRVERKEDVNRGGDGIAAILSSIVEADGNEETLIGDLSDDNDNDDDKKKMSVEDETDSAAADDDDENEPYEL